MPATGITQATSTPASTPTTPAPKQRTKDFPRDFIMQSIEKACDDTGWANLGTFGSYLTKVQSDFDTRIFGYKKLSDLVKAKTDIFDWEERLLPSGGKVLYVRAKK